MGLIDLKTDLKSLKYGNDQRGGGSSNQPYIVTPIPDGYADIATDFLLRNGRLNFVNSLQDVSRLTKFFLDTKSPNGLLFTAKQLLLERQNVEIPGGFNRIYNPLGTLAQAGVVSTGYHLNKQGLNPFQRGYFNGGRNGYYYFTKERNDINETVIGGENRLVLLYNTKQIETPKSLDISSGKILYNISDNSQLLFSYSGGPNSVRGFGKTNIKITSDRTDLVSGIIKNNPKYIIGTSPNWLYNPSYNINLNGQPGVSVRYTSDLDLNEDETLYTSNPNNILNRDIKSTGLTGETPQQSQLNALNDVYVLTQKQIIDKSYTSPQEVHGKGKSNTLTDFRYENLADKPIPKTDYVSFNRETTYNISKTYYSAIRTDPNDSISSDDINISNVLQPTGSEAGNQQEKITNLQQNDLVKFYFEINNNNELLSTQNFFLFFRAYLNDLGDNYKPEWQSYKYIGRAENFYKYSGFSRDISLGFTIYAHSRDEMRPIYEKLNYLVGTTAPDYSEAGYMRGNFVNLTVGDYLNNVPGIIQGIDLKPSFDAGWDIDRDVDGNPESNGLQLPKMIDITLQFTPIHTFTPQFRSPFISNFV